MRGDELLEISPVECAHIQCVCHLLPICCAAIVNFDSPLLSPDGVQRSVLADGRGNEPLPARVLQEHVVSCLQPKPADDWMFPFNRRQQYPRIIVRPLDVVSAWRHRIVVVVFQIWRNIGLHIGNEWRQLLEGVYFILNQDHFIVGFKLVADTKFESLMHVSCLLVSSYRCANFLQLWKWHSCGKKRFDTQLRTTVVLNVPKFSLSTRNGVSFITSDTTLHVQFVTGTIAWYRRTSFT